MLLDFLSCLYFIKDFLVHSREKYWFTVLLFFFFLQCRCLFLFQNYAGLIKQVEKFSLFLCYLKGSV